MADTVKRFLEQLRRFFAAGPDPVEEAVRMIRGAKPGDVITLPENIDVSWEDHPEQPEAKKEQSDDVE